VWLGVAHHPKTPSPGEERCCSADTAGALKRAIRCGRPPYRVLRRLLSHGGGSSAAAAGPTRRWARPDIRCGVGGLLDGGFAISPRVPRGQAGGEPPAVHEVCGRSRPCGPPTPWDEWKPIGIGSVLTWYVHTEHTEAPDFESDAVGSRETTGRPAERGESGCAMVQGHSSARMSGVPRGSCWGRGGPAAPGVQRCGGRWQPPNRLRLYQFLHTTPLPLGQRGGLLKAMPARTMHPRRRPPGGKNW